MSQITASTEIGDGIKVDLVFDYQPLEKQTMTDPEVPEEAQLTEVLVGGVDVISLLDDDAVYDLEQKLLSGEFEE